MGRDIDLTDNGAVILREAVGNGVAAVTVDAPADLTGAAGSYAMELLDQLPAGLRFLQIDASGKWTTASPGALTDLDAAYDSGGPGLGRVIVADAGAVEITTPAASGNNCLRLLQSDNQLALFIQKLGVGGGGAAFITDAGTGTSLLVTKTGPSGLTALFSGGGGSLSVSNLVDIQGDSAGGALSVISLDLGTNPVIKTGQFGAGVAIHVDNSGNAFEAIVRLESGAGVTDAKVEFVQAGVRRFELGYDESAGLFVIGLLDFTDPVLLINDSSGAVGIRVQTGIPLAQFHVESAAILVQVIESAMAESRLSLMDSGTTDQNTVGIGCIGDNLLLRSNSALSLTVGAGGALTAANWSVDALGNASFGDDADSNDHTLSIIAGSVTDNSILGFGDIGNPVIGSISYSHTTESMAFTQAGAARLEIRSEGLRLGFLSGGSFTGINNIFIANGTAPSASITNGVTLYAEDVTASSELKVRDESGAVTVLSPHSEVHGHKLSEDMAWSFYSERDGKYIWVDMLRVIRAVEHLYGYELVYEGEAA